HESGDGRAPCSRGLGRRVHGGRIGRPSDWVRSLESPPPRRIKRIRMAKSSTARKERIERTRERDSSLAALRGSAHEAVSPDLDRLIHERIRLGIVSALAVNRSLTFNELKALLKTTD